MAEQISSYQEFADRVQAELRQTDEPWKQRYAEYAQALTRNKEQIAEARRGFRMFKPLCCYITLGESIKGGQTSFDLRYLGQSVGRIVVHRSGQKTLHVSKETADNSKEYFAYSLGEISADDWSSGKLAQDFRAFYKALAGRRDIVPRQQEHMVESALFSELEKQFGDGKAQKGIQPITYIDNTRFHMKTALKASGAAAGAVSLSARGGEIDVFCRRRQGKRSRLTVLEVKDANESGEPFSLVIQQAIAYAVFIRELVRSPSGAQWMALWGMGNQPWEKRFTIDAAAVMPKGGTAQFPFAKQILHLEQDQIELHYMAFLGDEKPRDGMDVRFESSFLEGGV